LTNGYQQPHDSAERSASGFRTLHAILLGVFVLLAGLALLLTNAGSNPELEARVAPFQAEISAPPQPAPEELAAVVPAGSSMTALLGDYFSPGEILELNKRSRDIFPFTRICAGHPYRIQTVDGIFSAFIYEIDSEEELLISRNGEQIDMERKPIHYDIVVEQVRGEITSSLFDAVTSSGEEPELAIALADIFGWDINFILDLRVGDSFQALVEKRFRKGELAGYGDILAAEFVNQGRSFKAFRFADGEQKASFYNENGENMRKAFLKAPLSFTRISSGYSMRRLHPVTKTVKPHPAIDYAAPVGTPVKTVGDGTVTRKGYASGNGNYLEVTHSNGYSSMYLHLKGFARGIKKGARVSQGQVIGYVGSSGMSTGPHLDFRMKRYGSPINPLKLKAPAAAAVSTEHAAEFQQLMTPLLAQLERQDLRARVAGLAGNEQAAPSEIN